MSGSYYALDAAYNSLQSQLSSLNAQVSVGIPPPIIRAPQNATNTLTQDQVIDDRGRVASSNIYNGGYGGAQAPSQYLPIDPLPKYPLLCGVWNNSVQSSLLTNSYEYTGFSNHSTLSIRINNLSQYSRYNPIVVRLSIACINNAQPIGSPPYPYTSFGSWTGNVLIFPTGLRVPSTIDPTIPVASENFVFPFFDLKTNDILFSNSPAVYSSSFLLVGGPPNLPQSIFNPEGRSLWAYDFNTSGTINPQLYPFVVDNVNDYAIVSVVLKNPFIYSGIPAAYSASVTAELVCASYQPVSNISFIC
jgi:hypothetical protein